MEDDKRLVFDTIPDKFDKWRIKYDPKLFEQIIKTSNLGPGKSCLEIGPGTGQASDFAIKSGCDYLAIELGEHLADKMFEKYYSYPNFDIVTDDFEKHDFGDKKFDLIFSAAAIQWINEDIAYRRSFNLLKDGGVFAMCFLRSEYKSSNPALFDDIQKVYDKYFVTDQPYDRKFDYTKGWMYGLTFIEERSYPGRREYNADEYIEYIGTHSDHIALKEEYKDLFFNGVRDAVIKHGNKIVFNDQYVLFLYKKSFLAKFYQIERELEGDEYFSHGISYMFSCDQISKDLKPLKDILLQNSAIGEDEEVKLTSIDDRLADIKKISEDWHFNESIDSGLSKLIEEADGYYKMSDDGFYATNGNLWSIFRIVEKGDELVLLEFFHCD